MHFLDHTEILVRSGQGGRGMVSFRSGRHCPKAGADGGDGGSGGDVYLVGHRGINTLSHLRFRHQYKAENGTKGGVNSRTGKNGDDLEIPVPLGTVAFDSVTNAAIGEVLQNSQRVLIAKGGKKGIGNERFLSSTHQAPEESTPGGPAEERTLKLELKLLADIGFAGFPNAGKSTLLSAISAAKPKIADYPFTTLVPNLGVVDVDANDLLNPKSYVAADIPGLIEGAADGKGLGHEFLKHLERTRVVAYVIDPFTQELDPVEQFATLKAELEKYSIDLASKPATIVVTKMDLAPDDFDRQALVDFAAELSLPLCFVASATRDGLDQLKRLHFELVTLSTNDEPCTKSSSLETPRRPALKDYRLVNQIASGLGLHG
jgi:GTP-binding protein